MFFSQVHEPIVSSNKRTIERINALLESEEDRVSSRVFTMQEQSFHHALDHNLSNEEIGLIPAVLNRWDSLVKEENGKLRFEKRFNSETYRLIATIGGKRNTVNNERTIQFVTFFRVTQREQKK